MEHTFLKRLILGHVSIVVVIVLSTVTALLALRSTIHQTERTSEIDQRLALIDHLRSDARELARSARRYLLTGDGKEQQRVFAIEGEMNHERARLQDHGRALDRELDAYVSAVVRSLAGERGEPGLALARFEDDLVRVRNPLSLQFEAIVSRERAQLDASRSSQRLARSAQWALAIAAVLGVLLTFGSIFVVVRALRRQAERTRGAEAVAERAATARKELLAASTELRNPLEKIMTQVAALRRTSRAEEDHQVLQSISNGAARVDNLLQQLLDVTAVQAGTLSLRRESSDVTALVEQAIAHHRAAAHERGMRLRFEARLSLSVFVDRQRIGHVLTSLLEVTIASARVGAEIVVSAVPAADGVRFALIDAGVSVPTPSVFQAAAGAPPNDLALHLCQRVIEAHGGRMGVDVATAGRTYWFTLPTEPRVLR